MNMPLDIAVDIGRLVLEAQAARLPLDISDCADDLLSRFPRAGLSRGIIVDTLKEEACAAGVALN